MSSFHIGKGTPRHSLYELEKTRRQNKRRETGHRYRRISKVIAPMVTMKLQYNLFVEKKRKDQLDCEEKGKFGSRVSFLFTFSFMNE